MGKLEDAIFATAFGILATHELDAVRNQEWLVLPVTRFLPENLAMTVFILAHIPLFGWLASVCWSQKAQTRRLARAWFAGFCCVHVGLHWLFRNDPNYLFSGWLSNGLILGSGLTGALLLVTTLRNGVDSD